MIIYTLSLDKRVLDTDKLLLLSKYAAKIN